MFKSSLLSLFRKEHVQTLPVERIRTHVNDENKDDQFKDEELYAAIDKMMSDNQIMLSDDTVFLI